MLVHMGKAQVKARVTRNLSPPPAVQQSTPLIQWKFPGRSVASTGRVTRGADLLHGALDGEG